MRTDIASGDAGLPALEVYGTESPRREICPGIDNVVPELYMLPESYT